MRSRLFTLLLLPLLLVGFQAQATISPSYPYNLQNGTTADATQVQANFNQVQADVNTNAAPLASPAFTGVPTAPTAGAGTNTTQLATTAFVQANAVPSATVLLGTQTVSAVASVSDTTHITSTYSHYRWECSNLVSVTDGVDAFITVKQGGVFVGGTSYTSYVDYRGAAHAGVNSGATSAFQIAPGESTFSNTNPATVVFEFWNPATVAPLSALWNFTGAGASGGGVTTYSGGTGNGTVSVSAATTGVKLAFASGNIATALCKLYGVQ